MKKPYVLCVVLFVGLGSFTQAQNEKLIDSLIQTIPMVQDGKIEAHIQAFFQATSSLTPSDAMEKNQQAIDVCKKYNRTYALRRFQAEALRSAFMAMDIPQKTKNTVQYFNFQLILVSAYFNTADYTKAREAGHEILRVYSRMDESVKGRFRYGIMSAYNTIGLNFGSMGQYDSALYYLELSRQMAHDSKQGTWKALTTGNRGGIYFKLGRYEDALRDYLYDARQSQQNRSWGSAIDAMIMISDIHRIKGNLKMASTYLDSSLYLQKKYVGDEGIPTNYWETLSDLEFARGHYVSARKAQEHYTEQKIENVTRQGAADLAKIQNSFELKTKQAEIDALTESAGIREEQLKLQRYALIAGLAALLLALALVINFIYNYRRQKRINTLIRKHQQEMVQTNEQLQIAYHELKTAQGQLVQTEKMAFLGRLISSIAHEINTPLGAIKASAQNVQSNLNTIKKKIMEVSPMIPPQHTALVLELISQPTTLEQEFSYARQRERKKACIGELKKMAIENPENMAEFVLNIGADRDYPKWLPLLQSSNAYEIFCLINKMFSLQTQNANIVLAVSKASKILFALKTYSHPGSESGAIEVNLVDNIEMVLAIYVHNLTHTELVRGFENVPLIKGFPEELSQVWTNSIHNALQAMNGVGKLIIVIARHGINEVKVEITDNGGGITPENQKHLFEPFFTTKPAGEGTGLGLSIIKKIMDKHRGHIECESEVLRGTTFRFIFPVS